MSSNEIWLDALKHEVERGNRPERLIEDILNAVKDQQYDWLLENTVRHGEEDAANHCVDWLTGTSRSLSRSTSVVANLVEDVRREVYTRYLSALRYPYDARLPNRVLERLREIKKGA